MIENKIDGTADKAMGEDYGNYWLGKTQSANKLIMNIANKYKKEQLKRMKTLHPKVLNPRSRSYINFEDGIIVSLKRDGEFNLCYYDINTEPYSIFCNTPKGRARYNLPVNKEIQDIISDLNENKRQLTELKKTVNEFSKDNPFSRDSIINQITFAGELFANIEKKKSHPRVSDFLGISLNPPNPAALQKINYDIFDIISINGIDVQTIPYFQRLRIIEFLFPDDEGHIESRVKVIRHKLQVEGKKVVEIYNEWVENEYHEGIVIHDQFKKIPKP